MTRPPVPHGLLAEFTTPEAIVEAARRAHEAGYRCLDAYSPFPVEGLSEAIGFRRNRVALVGLIGGLAGGIGGYFMLWYSTVVNYPINVGGRPFHSWPAYIPITFEMIVLGASLAAVLGMLGLSGLPRPNHPVFAAKGFERATNDRFFLCLEADDPLFHPERTRDFLESLGARSITFVER